jgi:putative phosphoribosyl transferase
LARKENDEGAMMIRFRDRSEAGRLLAKKLRAYANRPEVLVLALPRGGVPVAFEVASALNAPLDVFLVRKLGVPGQEELAMGAIASGGVRVLNWNVLGYLVIPDEVIDAVTAREQHELDRRERAYRGNQPPLSVAGRLLILVDDGIATGSTMRAAVAALTLQQPARIIVAVPVAPVSTYQEIEREVDEIAVVALPNSLSAVGEWYEDFSPTSHLEVKALLERAAEQQTAVSHTHDSAKLAGSSRQI